MKKCSACGQEVGYFSVPVGRKIFCEGCAEEGMGAMISRITGQETSYLAGRLWAKQYEGFEPPVWAYYRALEMDAVAECYFTGQPAQPERLGDLYGS